MIAYAISPAPRLLASTHSAGKTVPISTTHPYLPDDVLRQLLENAASTDSRTALTLPVLSHKVRAWIEEFIYSNVTLNTARASRAFIRTLEYSRTKNSDFFATFVKSLFASSEVDAASVAKMLSICRGVVHLSFWGAPQAGTRHNPRTSPYSSPTSRHRALINDRNELTAFRDFFPTRLSLLLHENHVHPFKPQFDLSSFSRVTHFSIVNRWEEWTTWEGISNESFPCLTHLKLDLVVGGNKPTNALLLDIADPGQSMLCKEPEAMTNPWVNKMTKVAGALGRILHQCPNLQVCVVLLRCDAQPADTAKTISEILPSVNGNRKVGPPTGFDPRLIFAWEKQPFRYTTADSAQEKMLWKAAEIAIGGQRCTSDYTILDCDHLVQGQGDHEPW